MAKDLVGTFHHPFTSIVCGPTQSGKSTFVQQWMINHKDYVNVEFDYIYIFMGTDEKDNPTLTSLKNFFPDKVSIFKCDAEMCKELETFVKNIMERKAKAKQNGCIIFDDLMKELSNCEIILDIFTKYSSHWNVSVIFITQNVFYKGKNSSQNVTLYRNTHILILFKSFLDTTTLRNIASRISSTSNSKNLNKMLREIIERHRYVVIRGDMNTHPLLRYTTGYFSSHPIPHYLSLQPNMT